MQPLRGCWQPKAAGPVPPKAAHTTGGCIRNKSGSCPGASRRDRSHSRAQLVPSRQEPQAPTGWGWSTATSPRAQRVPSKRSAGGREHSDRTPPLLLAECVQLFTWGRLVWLGFKEKVALGTPVAGLVCWVAYRVWSPAVWLRYKRAGSPRAGGGVQCVLLDTSVTPDVVSMTVG